jgi:anti-sigma regulatory factor (Ser/Thr protein kinase)
MSTHLAIAAANRLSELGRIMTAVEEFGAQNGLSGEVIYALNLAVEELFTNTVSYGYADKGAHTIDIRLDADAAGVQLEIEDDAREFDPLKAPTPDTSKPLEERPIGGLGIHLVRQTMNEVRYDRRGNRNIVTLRKKRSPSPGTV